MYDYQKLKHSTGAGPSLPGSIEVQAKDNGEKSSPVHAPTLNQL
jgi:hypothetical protein